MASAVGTGTIWKETCLWAAETQNYLQICIKKNDLYLCDLNALLR